MCISSGSVPRRVECWWPYRQACVEILSNFLSKHQTDLGLSKQTCGNSNPMATLLFVFSPCHEWIQRPDGDWVGLCKLVDSSGSPWSLPAVWPQEQMPQKAWNHRVIAIFWNSVWKCWFLGELAKTAWMHWSFKLVFQLISKPGVLTLDTGHLRFGNW